MKFTSKDNLNSFTAKFKAWVKARKIKASDLDSTGATAGQVYTADGSGGGSYQTPQAGTTVVANPTLAGGEAALAGLQVGNTKYGMPYLPLSGGTMTGDLVMGSLKKIKYGSNYTVVERGGGDLAFGNTTDRTILASKNEDLMHVKGTGSGQIFSILDASNTSANPTLAGSEAALESLQLNGTSYKNQPSSMQILTTAPAADNTSGIKIVVLSSEPATKYNGYLYLITA